MEAGGEAHGHIRLTRFFLVGAGGRLTGRLKAAKIGGDAGGRIPDSYFLRVFRHRSLMFHGLLLFTLGLLTGLVQQQFANPRMGLAAHLEGLMNGTFLLALGGAWREARLSPRSSSVAYAAALLGGYGNWAVTTLSAVLGTTAMTPIAGAGYEGSRLQEALITGGFVAVGILMLTMAAFLLKGFSASRGSGES
jgi:hydroxylaminobenzene mutase